MENKKGQWEAINQHCLMAILDSKGFILESNSLFNSTVLRDSKKKSLSELLSLKHHQEQFDKILNNLQSGKKWKGELCFKGSNDQMSWIDLSLTPSLDESCKLKEIFFIGNDISEKKIEDDKISTLFSKVNVSLWDWTDISKDEVWWSPALYEVLKYDQDRRNSSFDFFRSILHPDDRDAVIEATFKLIEDNQQYLMDFRMLCGDGTYKWIQSSAIALRNEEGKAYRVIGTVVDIHQKKKIEDNEDVEKQKTVQASKLATLGEMAAGLAHEVNNPLTIIFGYIRVMEMEISSNQSKPEVLLNFLSLIKTAADRAANLVSNLKEFARDSGQDSMADHSVSEIIHIVQDLCQERFIKDEISLEFDITDDPIIHCRKTEISQVILNLLFNAHDAIQELPKKWVRVEVKKEQNQVKLAIIDSGPGILPEIVQKLFTPFFTTKKNGLGTGLGLSISQKILLDHGGEIYYDIDSLNTRFVINLPLYYELT